MTLRRYDAKYVASWFLAWAEDFEEGAVTNLKLQKLLYYAQGNALARWGAPVFRQPIEAWMHGPVVSDVYHAYKGFGGGVIPAPTEFDWSIADDATHELLASVWRTYGGFSAWKLREMTHAEDPWKRNFSEQSRGREIPLADMREYFAGIYAAAGREVAAPTQRLGQG